jgi:7-carboxy-7-deazaguanine synthase
MRILEVYESIHGELPHIGKPVTIVRLAGCNLSCAYCDAPMSDPGYEMSINEVVDKVIEFDNKDVLVTGGEPLLQGQATIDLCRKLVEQYYVTVETNGTLDVAAIREVPYLSVVMDVKLDHAYDLGDVQVNNLDILDTPDAIKFVYWDWASYQMAWEFIHDHVKLMAPYQIIFSPVDKDNSFVMDFVAKAKDLEELDLRIQVQIHKYLNCG